MRLRLLLLLCLSGWGYSSEGCVEDFWVEKMWWNVTITLFFHKKSRKSLIISNKMRVFEIFCVYLRAFSGAEPNRVRQSLRAIKMREL